MVRDDERGLVSHHGALGGLQALRSWIGHEVLLDYRLRRWKRCGGLGGQ